MYRLRKPGGHLVLQQLSQNLADGLAFEQGRMGVDQILGRKS
jgi:hypothetical protein